jgi:drug/metabolite transporter (DMT)-like permease
MRNILLMMCTVAGTAYAQLVFKWQAPSFKADVASAGAPWLRWILLMFHPWMLSAFAAMFAGTVCWMLALRETPLTRAYMFVGFTFVVVMLAGSAIFREPLSFARIAGCTLIVAGVIVGGRG